MRVGARQLRFKLAEYYRDFGQSDPVIISLPKGRYVPHFELRETPADPIPVVEPFSEPAAPAPETPVRRSFRLGAGIALGALALTAVGILLYRSRSASSESSPSVAVLPFRNLSPDTADKYFAEGLTEEITDELAHIAGLRVLPDPPRAPLNKKLPTSAR